MESSLAKQKRTNLILSVPFVYMVKVDWKTQSTGPKRNSSRCSMATPYEFHYAFKVFFSQLGSGRQAEPPIE
jgi:hypothetical protein